VIWFISGLLALTFLATATVLYLFDPRLYSFYPTCLFHRTTGLLCPGCGSLRAVHELLHGHLRAAFQYNPLLMAGLPFLAVYGAVILTPGVRKKGFKLSRKWVWSIIALGLAISIWRNIPGCPFAIAQPG
jgi:hypothetical protein